MRTDILRDLDPVDLNEVRRVAENAVFDDLFDAVVTDTLFDPLTHEDGLATRDSVKLGRRPKDTRRIRGLAVTAAAVLALVFGFSLGEGPVTSPTHLHAHGAWKPAQHVVIQNFGGVHYGKGKWQLVADVYGVGWQQNSSGPPPGQLTCAAVNACYAMAGHYTSPMAGAPFLGETFYASNNLGVTWSALPMPTGLFPTTALSCPSANECALGGTIGNEDVFAETTDGGHNWTVTPTVSSERILYLRCTSPASCEAVATTHNDLIAGLVQSSPNPDRTEWLLDTSDGGSSWNAHQFLVGQQVLGLSCPRTGTCVVLGVEPSSAQPGPGVSFAQRTTDGGAHWSNGVLPAGVFIATPLASGLSCADAEDCMALVEIAAPNVDECQGSPPNEYPPAGRNSCSTGATTDESAVVATEDGGLSWQLRPLPSDVPLPQLGSVSCPTATTCWISGSDATPMQIGSVSDGGSPILVGTTDGGATWSLGTFQIPMGAPNYLGQAYVAIGWISCPAASSCLAFGVGAQSAPSVPEYRYNG